MREYLRAATFGRSLIDFRLCDFATATLAQAQAKKHRRSPKWRSAAFCAPKPGRPEAWPLLGRRVPGRSRSTA
nr:MAG TPA: hypothetical protein [Caudoviricetes sp.]